MALGKILRDAREQQGFSVAQVAESTHMMVQIVEELEREDFHRIAAPIYGRGFIKLYAEFLSLDAEPLVKEFNTLYSGAQRPVVATRLPKPAEAPPATEAAPAPAPAAPPRQPVVPHQAVPPADLASRAPEAEPTVPARPELRLEPDPDAASRATAQALDDLFGSPMPRQQASAGMPEPRAAAGAPQSSRAAQLGASCREGVAATAAFVRAQARAISRLPLRRRPALLAAAAGGVVLAGLVAWFAVHRPPERRPDTDPESPATLEIVNVLPPPDPYVD